MRNCKRSFFTAKRKCYTNNFERDKGKRYNQQGHLAYCQVPLSITSSFYGEPIPDIFLYPKVIKPSDKLLLNHSSSSTARQ